MAQEQLAVPKAITSVPKNHFASLPSLRIPFLYTSLMTPLEKKCQFPIFDSFQIATWKGTKGCPSRSSQSNPTGTQAWEGRTTVTFLPSVTLIRLSFYIFCAVMADFMCQLGQAVVPHCLVKHSSRCCCEDIF